MKTIKTTLLTIAVLLCSISVNAYDFKVDGIYYEIADLANLTVRIVFPSSSSPYEGDFIVPSTVSYENETFIVAGIGSGAFRNANITSIVLPETLRRIGYEAFSNIDNLKSVVIPQNVEYIGERAFWGCENLREIFFLGDNYPETNYYSGAGATYPFGYTFATFRIYVKDKEKFNNTGDWKYYKSANEGRVVEYVTFGQNEFDYNGQAPTVTYTNNLANKYNLTMDMSGIQKEAGTHEVTLKAVYSNGLELNIPYTYTITKAPLTIDVNNAQRLYGEQNPTFTYSVTGFVNNENESVFDTPITLASAASMTSNVGTYPIQATASAKNYEFNVKEGTLTVKKAPLTVKANDKTRVYGDEDPQFDVTYIGLRNGETAPVLTSDLNLSTDAVKRSHAGTYEIMVSGGVATNYEFTEYQSGKLTVTQAPLTITAQSTVRKYGDENPTFQYAYSGFRNNDTEASLQTLPTVTTAATPFSGIGTYAITPNGATAKNYAITYENGTLTIEKAPLTIRANDVSRMYGDENPLFTFSYTGFKNGETEETLTAQPLATSASQTSYAGTYDIVPGGAAAKNYAITYENGILTITKAPLSVTAVSNTRIYGDENPQIELVYTGFRNGDKTNSITSAPTIRTEATALSPVGTYALTPEGGMAANYEFAEYIPGTLTVGKAPLTLIANDASRLYFEENPAFTFRGEGFKNNETEEVLTAAPHYSCAASRVSGVGEYVITPQGASAGNYDIAYKTGKLTVNKRTLEVAVSNYTRAYNEENPKFELAYRGFVNNETEAVLTQQPTVTCEADKTTDVGVYQIIADGAEAANYQFDYKSGTLTIEKATQEIVWEQDLSDVALGTQLELTAVATSGLAIEYDLADNDIVSIYETNGRIYLDCSRCGSVTIKALQDGNHNYHSALRVYKTLVITDPTGINATTATSGLVDVYTLQGVMVKRQIAVEDIEKELPAGIYIVNGKKMAVSK